MRLPGFAVPCGSDRQRHAGVGEPRALRRAKPRPQPRHARPAGLSLASPITIPSTLSGECVARGVGRNDLFRARRDVADETCRAGRPEQAIDERRQRGVCGQASVPCCLITQGSRGGIAGRCVMCCRSGRPRSRPGGFDRCTTCRAWRPSARHVAMRQSQDSSFTPIQSAHLGRSRVVLQWTAARGGDTDWFVKRTGRAEVEAPSRKAPMERNFVDRTCACNPARHPCGIPRLWEHDVAEPRAAFRFGSPSADSRALLQMARGWQL